MLPGNPGDPGGPGVPGTGLTPPKQFTQVSPFSPETTSHHYHQCRCVLSLDGYTRSTSANVKLFIQFYLEQLQQAIMKVTQKHSHLHTKTKTY